MTARCGVGTTVSGYRGSPLGGVFAIADDAPACRSSTVPSQNDLALIDPGMPLLAPGAVRYPEPALTWPLEYWRKPLQSFGLCDRPAPPTKERQTGQAESEEGDGRRFGNPRQTHGPCTWDTRLQTLEKHELIL